MVNQMFQPSVTFYRIFIGSFNHGLFVFTFDKLYVLNRCVIFAPKIKSPI